MWLMSNKDVIVSKTKGTDSDDSVQTPDRALLPKFTFLPWEVSRAGRQILEVGRQAITDYC